MSRCVLNNKRTPTASSSPSRRRGPVRIGLWTCGRVAVWTSEGAHLVHHHLCEGGIAASSWVLANWPLAAGQKCRIPILPTAQIPDRHYRKLHGFRSAALQRVEGALRACVSYRAAPFSATEGVRSTGKELGAFAACLGLCR